MFTRPVQRLALGISKHLLGGSLAAALGSLAGGSLAGHDRSLVLELRVGMTSELFQFYDSSALDAVVVLRHAESRRGGELLAVEQFGWFAAPSFALVHGAPLPLATQAPPCSLRRMAVETLGQAGLQWREAFVGGGVATLGPAVEAGLGVAALLRPVASPGWIDAGTRFGLPALPTREVVLHSRTSGGAAACLRLLAGALRHAR